MKTVYIMIGVAGSGKSSYVKNFKSESKLHLSSDEIREEFSIDDNNKVFQIMNKRLFKELKENQYQDIFYDATNLSRKRRAYLYREIKRMNSEANVVAVAVLKDLSTIKEQNSQREGKAFVPENVIEKMYKNLQVPRLSVDCDLIEVISDSNLFDKEKELYKTMNHDSPYHKESVKEHIELTIKEAEKTKDNVLIEVAKWHDLGKGITREENVNDNEAVRYFKNLNNGLFYRYLNHEFVSAMYYLAYVGNEINISQEKQDILEIIFHHMTAHNYISPKTKKANNINDELLDRIYSFAKIDSESKIVDEEILNTYKTLLKKENK